MTVRVELEGRLGSEPSVREVNGRDFVELSVAVSQGYWSKTEDRWVDQAPSGTASIRRPAGRGRRRACSTRATPSSSRASRASRSSRAGTAQTLRHQGERGRHLREPHSQKSGRLTRPAYAKTPSPAMAGKGVFGLRAPGCRLIGVRVEHGGGVPHGGLGGGLGRAVFRDGVVADASTVTSPACRTRRARRGRRNGGRCRRRGRRPCRRRAWRAGSPSAGRR